MSILIPTVILTAIGVLVGTGLAWASRVFAVQIDPRIEAVTTALPGVNCGGCGYPGCEALATAIVAGKVPPKTCTAADSACVERVSAIMGIDAEAVTPMMATVVCQGKTGVCRDVCDYTGMRDCRAAMLASSHRSCFHACLGFGTCQSLCRFGAITMEDGLAKIDPAKCTGCTVCVASCPKGVLRMEPKDRIVSVLCHNTERGRAVRDDCTLGCIACTRCMRVCPNNAIRMQDNLPVVDYERCTHCLECAKVCPTKTIRGLSV